MARDFKVVKNCFYCGNAMGRKGAYMETCDHMIPLSRGGSREPWNLLKACAKCNGEKADLNYEEYRLFLSWKKGLLNPTEGKWQTITFYGEKNPEKCIAGYDAKDDPMPTEAVAIEEARTEVVP